jgi:hypothetical protein
MNLIPIQISVGRRQKHRPPRARLLLSRFTAIFAGTAGMLATTTVVSASAATSGSNTASVNLAPPVVRSITVSPATATFGPCFDTSGAVANGLVFPNGTCQIGSTNGAGVVNGGITITNGNTASSGSPSRWVRWYPPRR